MNKKELMHTIFVEYFVIYNLSMMCTILFCYFNQPKIKMLPVSYLGQLAVFSFLACLPTTVYYFKLQNVIAKDILHTIFLEVILLAEGYKIGMYQDFLGGIIFFIAIIVVDILVRLFNYFNDCYMAIEINKALKSRVESKVYEKLDE